jgi:Ca2+-binding EF-hand superfamily protein
MRTQFGRITLLLCLAALLMSGCATTEDKKAQADIDALCASLDLNQDGKITKEEFVARATDKKKAAEIFDMCDSRKKGYLTYEDVQRQYKFVPAEMSIMPMGGVHK